MPLYFLAKKSGISNVLTISATHFANEGKRGDFSITYLPEINLKNHFGNFFKTVIHMKTLLKRCLNNMLQDSKKMIEATSIFK